jgi:hypothetical protein
VTGARAHAGAKSLVNVDLKDFFHSVDDRRVARTLERSLMPRLVEETREVAEDEAKPLVELIVRLVTWPVDGRPRPVLPQGAPTSPYLANLAARPLDIEIRDLLRELPGEFTYTRYADDLTISAPHEIDRSVMGEILRVVQRTGFIANPTKIRIASTIKGSPHFVQKLEVTGLALDPANGTVRIPRARMDRFRATIHQAALLRSLDEDTVRRVEGIVSFVHMVYGGMPPGLVGAVQRFEQAHRRSLPKPGKSKKMARRRALGRETYE